MEKQGYREALERLDGLFPERMAISVKEASKVLKVSEDAIYDYIKRVKNPLPAKKLGGRVIIPITQFARWMC